MRNVNVFKSELICLEFKLQFIYIVNSSSIINISLLYIIYVFFLSWFYFIVRRSLESWESETISNFLLYIESKKRKLIKVTEADISRFITKGT